MKKNFLIIFILMSLCVAGVTALQLYFSYRNYTATTASFKRESNEAFSEAIDSTFSIHRHNAKQELVAWLTDTTQITITKRWDAEKRSSVFTIKELGTDYARSGEIVLSISGLDGKEPMTPIVKRDFIHQIGNMVMNQLKSGGIIYFTDGLGRKVDKAYFQTPIDIKILEREYASALKRRTIEIPFKIEEGEAKPYVFCTKEANLSLQGERWVKACFNNTDMYLLEQLKWILIGSLLLIIITLACFWYTARTLLSQQKLNNIKDDFINNMTHEIHTPLTSVLVTAEALKKFQHDEESRENYIDIILHQSRKLSSLTDEILTGARIDKQGMALTDYINVNQLLQEIGEGYSRIIVQLIMPDDNFFVKGNRLHLTNAINNLVDNAIKYNTAEKSEVRIALSVLGKQLIITIADNGPGIQDSDKKKIFEQFYRMHSGNLHDVKGYGLGLNYVRKVVRAHKGIITIRDNFPSGAVFTIKLPL